MPPSLILIRIDHGDPSGMPMNYIDKHRFGGNSKPAHWSSSTPQSIRCARWTLHFLPRVDSKENACNVLRRCMKRTATSLKCLLLLSLLSLRDKVKMLTYRCISVHGLMKLILLVALFCLTTVNACGSVDLSDNQRNKHN